MANWKIEISGKHIRKASVEKLAEKLKDEFNQASIRVSDNTPPESRSDRFARAVDLVHDAHAEFESLRDELQEWYDNLPESFQSGDKGDQLQTAIDELESMVDECDELSGRDVEFPQMYG